MGIVTDALKEVALKADSRKEATLKDAIAAAVRYPVVDSKLLMAKKTSRLSHYDAQGQARMVDVSQKPRTAREAEASAFVAMTPEVLRALPQNPKGDPLEVARTAGIMAAKRTSELIPMCHPVPLSHIAVTLRVCENGVSVATKVKTTAETGVEMEALVAASVAALTVYDMCKALDKGIEIQEVVLERKSGGKSGDYRRSTKPAAKRK
ncbi:MAG: cyclic pyranopterin monophosphate synthase MoaC [Terriglobales bacterium]